MKTVFSVLLLSIGLSLFGQTKGSNRLYLSYSLQNYRDKHSLRYEGPSQGIYIDPLNTDAHCWVLAYERQTRNNVLAEVGLLYGIRNYDLSNVQDMTNFDPQAKKTLNGYLHAFGDYGAKINYMGLRLLVGYSVQVTPKWAIKVKAGMSEKLFIHGGWGEFTQSFKYINDLGQYDEVVTTQVETRYGRPEMRKPKFSFPARFAAFEWYVGTEYQYHKYWIKSFALGIEGAVGLEKLDRHETVIIYSSPTVNQLFKTRIAFIDRNISVGIRMAVGLWK